MELPPAPHRLLLDGDALVANWRWLRDRGGSAACGACIKADGYGLGAAEAFRRLADAGCRDFYVSTWAEAAAIPFREGVSLSVFHGVQPGEEAFAAAHWARPVLNSAEQVARWRPTGLPCDAMVDTGMNRLGLSQADVRAGVLADMRVDTFMSHLVAAEQDAPTSERQLRDFAPLADAVAAKRASLANSAGVQRGRDYAFDLTRPGLSLYGGRPGPNAGGIGPVVALEARVVQRRQVACGHSVGYGSLWRATRDTDVAVVNLGYADGVPRSLTNTATATAEDGTLLRCVGRVSMDLMCLEAASGDVAPPEGTWVRFALDLPSAAAQADRSQYELLTGLGDRLDRRWTS